MDTERRLRRGQAIKRRREAHGIGSLRAWAEMTGINRATLTKAEGGLGSDDILDRLDEYLDQLDRDNDLDTSGATDTSVTVETSTALAAGVIETVVKGPSSTTRWEVTFHSHPEDLTTVTAQVERLLKALEEDVD